MRFLISAVVALALCGITGARAETERRTVGVWQVSVTERSMEILTSNESGSTLGLLCFDACIVYLETGTRCNDGETYVAMFNAESGAAAVDLACRIVESGGRTRYVAVLPNVASAAKAIGSSESVGFAIPLRSGQFKVTRFATKGLDDAAGVANELKKRRARGDGGKFRDLIL